MIRMMQSFLRKVIENVIRKEERLLVSDNVAMKALSGSMFWESFSDLMRKIFAVGYDIVFHYNGHLEEMFAIAHTSRFYRIKHWNVHVVLA